MTDKFDEMAEALLSKYAIGTSPTSITLADLLRKVASESALAAGKLGVQAGKAEATERAARIAEKNIPLFGDTEVAFDVAQLQAMAWFARWIAKAIREQS